MKNRSEIWLRSLDELGERCSVSTSRSAAYAVKRATQEGDSFFTITLPAFGKEFENALRTGRIAENAMRGFKRRKYTVTLLGNNGMPVDEWQHPHGIPSFLGEFLALVFDNGMSVPWAEMYPPEPQTSRLGEDLLGFQMVPHAYGPSGPPNVSTEVWIDAVHGIRQLCLMFAKEESLCDDSKTQAALQQYKDTDQELDDPFPTK